MKYIITQEQVNGLIAYLQGKPFIEVEAGIKFLKELPEHSCCKEGTECTPVEQLEATVEEEVKAE